MMRVSRSLLVVTGCLLFGLFGCGSDDDAEVSEPAPKCALAADLSAADAPDFSHLVGCQADFDLLAQLPVSGAIPGAMSSKTIIDRHDDARLYFLNAARYPIHYDFAHDHLSGKGKPIVSSMSSFSQVEYFSPDRRFLLGAVTRYSGLGVWAYEIAPYDTASVQMITQAFDAVAAASFFGDELVFHPTSQSLEALAKKLPARIKVVDNDELYAGMSFVPFNPGTAVGQLRFYKKADMESGDSFVTPRDIAVLDAVPNDIAVVAGLITAEMQTPLSHVNVLSQNRGTPNMALLGAMADPALLALDGLWVKLVVTPFEYSLVQVDKAAADAWWEAHKPAVVKVPALALEVTELRDAELIGIDEIPSFGGKASNYGELARVGAKVPVPKAFAVPMAWYKAFEKKHGFDKQIEALLQDAEFLSNPKVRQAALTQLRDDMRATPLDPVFAKLLADKLAADYPGVRMRFRSSTNAEDLDGFTGAGLYDSKTYDPADPEKPMADAVRKVWSSLWNLRAFEERSWRGIDHLSVAMALLCHRGFPAEDSNGVALTNNIYNELEPAFYINAQLGDVPVVRPPGGELPDELMYYFQYPNQPVVWYGHSSLVEPGGAVLNASQLYELGEALDALHKAFAKHYQKAGKFYAMDVEWKFNTDPGDTVSRLWVKQARPHPGWSNASEGE